jgi:acyl-CoA dehydrogenase
MDTIGKKEARQEISMIKILAARTYLDVLDRAIQVHGAMGVTNDTPLAHMWQHARTLRIVDGPDEVHLQTIARRESRKFTEATV